MPHGVWLHLSEMSRTGKSTGIKSKYVDPKGLEVKEKEGDKIFYCNDFFYTLNMWKTTDLYASYCIWIRPQYNYEVKC